MVNFKISKASNLISKNIMRDTVSIFCGLTHFSHDWKKTLTKATEIVYSKKMISKKEFHSDLFMNRQFANDDFQYFRFSNSNFSCCCLLGLSLTWSPAFKMFVLIKYDTCRCFVLGNSSTVSLILTELASPM